MILTYATRDDGWPLCPICHEDELWSPFAWSGDGERPPMQAWIDAGLRCYLCGWERDGNPPDWPWEGRRGKRLPQCARCGQLELPGNMHLCVDVLLHMTIPPPVTPTAPTPPIVAPFIPPAAPPPNPTRFRVRYGTCFCLRCNLAVAYCMCSIGATDAQSTDGAESSLRKRIAEVKGK